MRTELGLRGRREIRRRGPLLALALALAGLPAAASTLVAQADPPVRVAGLHALAMLQGDVDQVLTGDHTVEEGETVEDIVVVGGDLRILGEVTGDAVVVGGDLIVEESGSVQGDAVVTGGEILNQGGRIRGEMRMLGGSGGAGDVSEEIRAAIMEEASADMRREMERAEAEMEREMRHAERIHVDVGRDRSSWFDPIRKGFAGLISTLALGLVLAGIGAALVFYGRSYLDTTSDTLRDNTLRSFGVGLAAGFLVIPAFVVMVVALAVSIIGIPLLLVAVPLYPLAIAAALAFGLLAAAHAIGERTAEQRSDAFDLRHRNAYAYLFTGLGMLLTPLLAGNLLGMTGFLDFIGTLLQVVTWAVIWAAATAGFGAVILSRLGTRRTFASPAIDTDFDRDPLFTDDPSGGPRV